VNSVGTTNGQDQTFTTSAIAPTVIGISPTSGLTTGGTTVTITGTNFIGATAVKFGTINATSYTVNSATQITATSPTGSAGTVDITVSTVGGTSVVSNADQFTYFAPSAVTTQAVSNIGSTTAIGNGNITTLGDPTPTAYGVCWNTTGAPTILDSQADNGAASTTGAFTAALTGLTANTTYYVRAYVTNSAGTSYGNEVTFTTTIGTGLNSLENQQITVYPNPVSDYVTLSGEKGLVRIYDMNSRMVLNQDITLNKQINVSSLPKGIYIVKTSTKSYKLVKD
jgi:hypothetical protein